MAYAAAKPLIRAYIYFVGFGMLSFILVGLLFMMPGTVKEHVTPDEAPIRLPDSATDVCFYRSPPLGPCIVVEFSVSETDFLAWAKSREWDVKEIGDEPHTIPRYTLLTEDVLGETIAKIKDGYFYDLRTGHDSGLQVAFDREKNRAYFYSNTR